MYKLPDGQMDIYSLYNPMEKLLDPENRWVIWADRIPWAEVEKQWAPRLYARRGAPGKSVRMLLGSLLIQSKLGLSDRETLRMLQENPYMQYFAGFQEFTRGPLYDHTLLGAFKRRLDDEARRDVRRLLAMMTHDS